MRIISVQKQENFIIIEVEIGKKFLGIPYGSEKRKFIADKEYPTGYWNWVEFPGKTWIDGMFSFKLDALFRFYKKENEHTF